MTRARLAPFLVLLLAALAGCGGGSGGGTAAQSGYRGLELTPEPAADFMLSDAEGNEVSLSGQRGRWVVVNFLYTYCPDVCPVIAGSLNAVLRSPVGKQAKLTVLTISVDPERDTPEAVRSYVRGHRLLPDYHYLIGSLAELEPVWTDYGVAVLPGPKGSVTHSTFSLLIDPEGRGRIRYDSTVSSADVIHDLTLLTGDGDGGG